MELRRSRIGKVVVGARSRIHVRIDSVKGVKLRAEKTATAIFLLRGFRPFSHRTYPRIVV